MIAAGMDRLVAGDPGAEVDTLEQSFLGQQVEHAVDARDPHPPPFPTQLVEDLLGGQAAVLAAEQLDDRTARETVPR